MNKRKFSLHYRDIFFTFDNTFFILIAGNETVSAIVKEINRLNPLEQQILLTRLSVKRLQKKGTGTIATIPKGIRKPTLKQIDKWKHESRKVR